MGRGSGNAGACFNTQPPEGGWRLLSRICCHWFCVSTHSRLKAAGWPIYYKFKDISVSTHSRLKAAGRTATGYISSSIRFNTQPPEGGWHQKPRGNGNNA